MRIGIYDPYLDDVGGGEKYMMTIADCLSKNHQVEIFWDNQDDFEAVKKRFILPLEGVKLVKNIFSPNVSFWKRLLATKKYNAIIFLSDGSIPFSFSKKLFLHIQQPLGKAITFSLKDTTKLSMVTAIFYNSEFTKSFNEGKFPGVDTRIIYPPVKLLPKSAEKVNNILHVGRFRVKNVSGVDDYKKQSLMIEVYKDMVDNKKIKGWKFIIAASVQEKDKEAFARLQKAADGYPIEFLINKNNAELWDAYNRAKIYWHASGYGEDLKAHPEYAEHFGISTVEAMGAGAVPVVINAGGQKEIVKDGENGFLWNTLDELQEKTKELIDNKKLWTSLSEKAQLRAKDFSMEKFCEEINKLVRG